MYYRVWNFPSFFGAENAMIINTKHVKKSIHCYWAEINFEKCQKVDWQMRNCKLFIFLLRPFDSLHICKKDFTNAFWLIKFNVLWKMLVNFKMTSNKMLTNWLFVIPMLKLVNIPNPPTNFCFIWETKIDYHLVESPQVQEKVICFMKFTGQSASFVINNHLFNFF